MPNSVLGSASSLPCRRDDGATVVPSWSLRLSCMCEEKSEQNLVMWSEVNQVSESLLSETFKHVFKLQGFYFERFRIFFFLNTISLHQRRFFNFSL